MSCKHGTSHRYLLWLSLLLWASAFAGCSSGKWLEAPNALNLAQLNAQTMALTSNTKVADNSCEALLPDIESMVKEADPQNFIFQAAVDPCSKAGMAFGEELRCEKGRLQVLCQ